MKRDDPKAPFLKAIDADPSDAAPHLIYADWLDEDGFDDEAQDQRFLGSILSDPYNPRLRATYARWLLERGRKVEAKQQRWLARVFSGKKVGAYEVYTRRNLPEKGYWARRLPELFQAHPEILVIVVSDQYLADSGLRHDRGLWKQNPKTGTRHRIRFRSPILFYRKATKARGRNVSGAWVA